MLRDDLADVELADRVFAPHYARALPQIMAIDADMLEKPARGSKVAHRICQGEPIDVFDVAGGWAWVRSANATGYVPVNSIKPA